VEHRALEDWPQTSAAALAVVETLAGDISLLNHCHEPKLVAAVDTAYGFGGETVYAAAVVTTFPEIQIVERRTSCKPATFPYRPGLLFFREGPAILEALEGLKHTVDLIIVHGHGIAHPRRCGMACHIGVLFDCPTVGCCRKLLAGRHRPVDAEKGSRQPIMLHGREVGLALRSKDNVKPIFISPGHKCDLDTARDIIMRNIRGYRLPEPLRLAHLFANKYKRYREKQSQTSWRGNDRHQ
jgi:deoxyribonuclease V